MNDNLPKPSGKGCHSVSKNDFTKNTEDTRRIWGLQERYDLHEGLVINVSSGRGICERDYPKIEAYLGLKGFTTYFRSNPEYTSQKTKGVVRIKYSNNTKTTNTDDLTVIKKSELIEQIRGFLNFGKMSPDIDEGYFDEEDVQSYLIS